VDQAAAAAQTASAGMGSSLFPAPFGYFNNFQLKLTVEPIYLL
jgi:hypothetical protein